MTDRRPAAGWRARAACRGLPTSLFYPVPGVPVTAALAVCARCPVRAECDEYARTDGEHFGIWGGFTEAERAELDRRNAALTPRVPARPGPPPLLSDDELVQLVWSLDSDQRAAAQIMDRLGVSVPTAYKYLHRAKCLGVIEQRGRQLYPASRPTPAPAPAPAADLPFPPC